MKDGGPKICAVIPAYNEEKTICEIIDTLLLVEDLDKIVVVDDGSDDETASAARQTGVQVVQMAENSGKGAALVRGFKEIEDADIVLTLDADLLGLTPEHVKKLLAPVKQGECDMSVGLFNEGRGLTDLARFFTLNLSGQRAIKMNILNEINDLDKEGFGVELLLNKYVKDHGKLIFVSLPELTHVMKEEKMGFFRGVKARLGMYWEIVKTIFIRIIKKQNYRK